MMDWKELLNGFEAVAVKTEEHAAKLLDKAEAIRDIARAVAAMAAFDPEDKTAAEPQWDNLAAPPPKAKAAKGKRKYTKKSAYWTPVKKTKKVKKKKK